MNYFKKYNLIIGWAAFAIATIAYLLTMEPTTSMWDCAEFIATSYKLEVGHPPGAPLFMMLGRIFTMFAPSAAQAALMVNTMSSLASGFTVLFLFWSITHLAVKIYGKKREELSKTQIWTVLGAGLIGSLSYAFLDTIWFSAIEGEVYAMSSLFTAIVFWAILMWENVADEPHANRWLVLIAYLMGLSIGVHILNLLVIPALVFVYYFRKTPKVTKWGVVKATAISGAILIGINSIIIPYSVSIGAWLDKFFVNTLSLPVNSGITFFALALFALAGWAIYYTHKNGRVIANTLILCTTVILIGYSSYATVVIRASANPPLNSNDPSNPYGLLSLLSRDQYGSAAPLLYGQAYSSEPISTKKGTIYYLGDDGKYKEKETIVGYEYPSQEKVFFPRMHRYDKERGYKGWVDITGRAVESSNGEMVTLPTAKENMEFFFSYQMNFMFWRYFLWNFVGRQNDIQGNGDVLNGNWLSGIKPIDALYLGPQDNLPSEMANNKGRNKYFFLPFLLGLIGLIYQLNRDKRNFVVVMWLFIMMGIALVVYFNTSPGEPRERDYVFAGAFYAFCIWIGMGVMWLREILSKVTKRETMPVAVAAIAICAVVPTILCQQNWDDHDRSHRYTARDLGYNHLMSMLPNSIFLNFGDNDSFPVWYNQEVEGVRTDVRVMNTSYLGAEWYIEQMTLKSNESDPVPFSLPRRKYYFNNERVPIEKAFKRPIEIKDAIEWIASDDERTQGTSYGGAKMDYLPSNILMLPVNKGNAIASGIVRAEDAHLMVDTIYLDLGDKSSISRDQMMVLDMLANFEWKRPVYFVASYFAAPYGLEEYLQFDGYAYRLVPIHTPIEGNRGVVGRIDTEYLYNRLVKEFKYANVADPRVYVDYFTQYYLNANSSLASFARLSLELSRKGDTIRAIEVMDAGLTKIPLNRLRYSMEEITPVIFAYYQAKAWDKGNFVLEDYARVLKEYITYFGQFKGNQYERILPVLKRDGSILDELFNIANVYDQEKQSKEIKEFLDTSGFI